MLIIIERAVTADTLASIRAAIAKERFDRPREASAGPEVLAPTSDGARHAASALLTSLRAHPTFEAATYAGAMTLPIFYRHGAGPGGSMHVDPPLLGGFPRLRADLAVSVCLGERDAYEGGEVVVDDGGMKSSWRGNAGDCIVCPAGAPRRVAPVVKGQAWMAVFWVQSLIADGNQRHVLFDLTQALAELERTSLAARHIEALRRSCTNLTRLWAEVPVPTEGVKSRGGAG
jgi:PKHD-type hydroxylase